MLYTYNKGNSGIACQRLDAATQIPLCLQSYRIDVAKIDYHPISKLKASIYFLNIVFDSYYSNRYEHYLCHDEGLADMR